MTIELITRMTVGFLVFYVVMIAFSQTVIRDIWNDESFGIFTAIFVIAVVMGIWCGYVAKNW